MPKTRKESRIWIMQVRTKGSNSSWSPTGTEWGRTRKELFENRDWAVKQWPELEYRIVQYRAKAV